MKLQTTRGATSASAYSVALRTKAFRAPVQSSSYGPNARVVEVNARQVGAAAGAGVTPAVAGATAQAGGADANADGMYTPWSNVVAQDSQSDVDDTAETEAATQSASDIDTASDSIASASNSMESASDSVQSAQPTSSKTNPTSSSSSSPSPTDSGVNLANDKNDHGPKFHLTYLIPLFAVLGLGLLFAIGGKIWGRIAYARERAVKRQDRYSRRMLEDNHANVTANQQGQWASNGWGSYSSPNTSLEKGVYEEEMRDPGSEYHGGYRPSAQEDEEEFERVHHPNQMKYDESDVESEHELRGPLSAIGGHLAGAPRGRAPPPAARLEANRYGGNVAANSWWSVQWSRHFGMEADRNTSLAEAIPTSSDPRPWEQQNSLPPQTSVPTFKNKLSAWKNQLSVRMY